MEQSESIKELATALAKAQGELKNVLKSGTAQYGKYAELGPTLEEVRPVTSKHGLAIVQMPVLLDDATTGLTTQVMHLSGEWIRSTFAVKMQQQTPQGQGSAITYGRRYALSAMLGIAGDDDDGQEGSSGKDPEKGREAPKKPAAGSQTPQLATTAQKAHVAEALRSQGVSDEDMRGELMERYGVANPERMTAEEAANVLKVVKAFGEAA